MSVFELFYLLKSNKLKFKIKDEETLLKIMVEDYFIKILHTKDEHLKIYSQLKLAENHKDQIDHFIISQAICEKMTLVSSDRKFREYIPQNLEFVFNKR